MTDTHQRSYCSADKVRVTHIPNTSLCSSFLPYLQVSANRERSEAWKKITCSTSKRNRTQVYSCPWSRIQTTIFHGCQPKTSGRCKYKGSFAPLVASSDLILVFPHTARMEDSFTATQLQHFAACGGLCMVPPMP